MNVGLALSDALDELERLKQRLAQWQECCLRERARAEKAEAALQEWRAEMIAVSESSPATASTQTDPCEVDSCAYCSLPSPNTPDSCDMKSSEIEELEDMRNELLGLKRRDDTPRLGVNTSQTRKTSHKDRHASCPSSPLFADPRPSPARPF